MKIQILGTGCPKCRQLEALTREAVASLALEATVEKVTDVEAIMNAGVMLTPALVIDGVVKSQGRLLGRQEIVGLLRGGK